MLVSAAGTQMVECLPRRPRTCNVLCNEAAMKLRLMVHGCGCSAVQGGGGVKVRASL